MSPTMAANPVTLRPQPAQEKFLASPADVCVYGGAAGGGKSWALLMQPLLHKRNPHFGAVIFRRTSPQITNEGGLWSESEKLYPLVGAVPRTHIHDWKFPSGATVSFRHLQHEKDRHTWQGSQIPLIGFDELTHFTEAQFWYLLSRNRSTCGVRPYARATCNPDADSWVASLLSWWIDQDTGLAIGTRAGAVRWCVRVNDRLEWADTAEELTTKFPGLMPRSFSFVPAKLSDNAALMAADPGYLATLLAMPMVERERLLGGNWKIRPAAGLVFNRSWFRIVEAAPAGLTCVRYWDKAGTEAAGDWTAGVKIGRSLDGRFFVLNVVRGQWSSYERNRIMRETAVLDGPGTDQVVEQEPGSGGKESAEISVRELAGYPVYIDHVTGDKMSRARPLSAQCEAGNVYVVRRPGEDWVEEFLNELHAFPQGKNDDQVDGASGGFNRLALETFDIPEFGQATGVRDGGSIFADPPEGVFLS